MKLPFKYFSWQSILIHPLTYDPLVFSFLYSITPFLCFTNIVTFSKTISSSLIPKSVMLIHSIILRGDHTFLFHKVANQILLLAICCHSPFNLSSVRIVFFLLFYLLLKCCINVSPYIIIYPHSFRTWHFWLCFQVIHLQSFFLRFL